MTDKLIKNKSVGPGAENKKKSGTSLSVEKKEAVGEQINGVLKKQVQPQALILAKTGLMAGSDKIPVPKNLLPEKIALPLSNNGHAHHVNRLASLIKIFHREDRVLIVITADPDSIASAVALKRILWRKVSHIVVASTNQVKRPDNLRLVAALRLRLPLLKDIDLKDFNKLAMVDSQPHHNPQTSGLHFAAVVDHHPVLPGIQPSSHTDFIDIRPGWGATASIMVAYLRAARIKPNQILATALFYAIKTDTQNFVRQGLLEDMVAFRWLYPLIHHPLLSEIERAPIDRSSYRVMLTALEQTVFYKQYAFVYVDKLDHADTLVLLADFLMQISGVNRTVASGVEGDKLVVVMRSGGLRSNLGRLAQSAFGSFGSAGGHKNMARAEISLANLDSKIVGKSALLGRFVVKHLKEALSSKSRSDKQLVPVQK